MAGSDPTSAHRQDISPDIRQSAFALVGDLARAACSYLSPALTQVIPRLLLRAVTLQPMSAEPPGLTCSLTQ